MFVGREMKMSPSGVFLLVVVLCCGSHISGVPLDDFYSYGLDAGDSRLPPNDDGSSPPVELSQPFLFFDREHTSLFVRHSYLAA